MQAIVVGFDGSSSSRAAVGEAGRLAEAFSATLHVVNVIGDTPQRSDMITGDTRANAERANDAIADDPGLVRVDVQSHVLEGSPAAALLDLAAKVDADVIVVGNRRVQGIDRVLGSVAIDVLRKAPCSVYVAHTT